MKTLFAALMGTALAAPAFAGGPVEPMVEPVIAPVPVPVAAGADWTGGYVGAQLGYGNVGSTGDVLDGDGFLGGVHAGYMYDFGQWVAGAELDYDWSDIDLNATDTLDSVARLKFKAGADLGQTFLYGTLGAAYAEATVGGANLSDSGYFGGIGMDYAVNDRWTVGSELLLHRFDNFDGTGIDVDATTATIRASYRF